MKHSQAATAESGAKIPPEESFQRLLIRYRMQSQEREKLRPMIFNHPKWNSLFVHRQLFDMPWHDDPGAIAHESLARQLADREWALAKADPSHVSALSLHQMCDLYGAIVCQRRYWNYAQFFFGHERQGMVFRIFRSLPLGRRLIELRRLIGGKHICTDEIVSLLMDFSDQGDREHVAQFAEFREDLGDIYPAELSNAELTGLIIQAERMLLGEQHDETVTA